MYKLHPCIIYNTIQATDGLREGVDGTWAQYTVDWAPVWIFVFGMIIIIINIVIVNWLMKGWSWNISVQKGT